MGPDYLAAHPVLASLQGRDFLTLRDFSPEEIQALVDLACELKRLQKEGKPHRLLPGKTLAMLFTSHRPGPGSRLKWAFINWAATR